jgi:hypothetical protein
VEARVSTIKTNVASSVVYFKHLDDFLKEWFLIG